MRKVVMTIELEADEAKSYQEIMTDLVDRVEDAAVRALPAWASFNSVRILIESPKKLPRTEYRKTLKREAERREKAAKQGNKKGHKGGRNPSKFMVGGTGFECAKQGIDLGPTLKLEHHIDYSTSCQDLGSAPACTGFLHEVFP
jgi:hypothetical protein